MARSKEDSFKAILPRGYLQACLLLLLSEGRAHGYDLYGRVDGFGLFPVDPGVVYRALHDMEAHGLVVSTRERESRRPEKRTYEPTENGRERLRVMTAEIQAVEGLLSVYEDRADRLAETPVRSAAA